jgi:hydrogenase nickel incorporation protein HypA/HybF
MHELSIAVDMVEIAESAAKQARAIRVEAVHLRLGVMAGVVKDALWFAYDVATRDTVLQGSQLVIEDVPLVIYCDTCQKEVALPSMQYFVCPDCGCPSTDIRQGRELEITSMEILTDETETAAD